MDFKTLYIQYSPQIFRVCMGYINDQEQAHDLTQETFISVWQNLSTFRNQSKISTWIFRIATNNCLRALERSKRMQFSALPDNLPEIQTESIEGQLAFLYNCIAELPETDRIIISLVLEDLPHSEIAAIVGLSEVNIRVRIHRIKERMALKFKKHGQFE